MAHCRHSPGRAVFIPSTTTTLQLPEPEYLGAERVAKSAFANVGVAERCRALPTDIQGVVDGRLGALLMVSSVLYGVETLGDIQDVVVMATTSVTGERSRSWTPT